MSVRLPHQALFLVGLLTLGVGACATAAAGGGEGVSGTDAAADGGGVVIPPTDAGHRTVEMDSSANPDASLLGGDTGTASFDAMGEGKSDATASANDAGHDTGLLDANVVIPLDAGAAYCPTGYTLVPYLTSTATTHTFAAPTQVLVSGKTYVAVVDTQVGSMVWQLYTDDAPIACNSLAFLALHHFFDGIAFHRVIQGAIVQGGDPNTLQSDESTWGNGGPGYSFENEVVPTLNFTQAGLVALANAGTPDSNGSQFFVTEEPLTQLNQMYTIFGTVTEGAAIIPQIAPGTGTGEEDPPTDPTRMLNIHICEK